jgi:hypothetical protein
MFLFTGDPHGRAARGQDSKSWGKRQQAVDRRPGRLDLLEIVEHEEDVPLRQPVAERVLDMSVRVVRKIQGGSDRPWDQGGIIDRRERHEECAIREAIRDLRRAPQCQSRLAGPARARQRDKAPLREEAGHGLELDAASDKARRIGRQVCPPDIECSQRWKHGGKTADLELIQGLRPGQVPESIGAEVLDSYALRHASGHETSGRAREEHLSAVRGRRDPGGLVHVDPVVVVAAQDARAGVHAHPDADPGVGGPRGFGQRELGGSSRGDRRSRIREHHQERVAFRSSFDAVVVAERGTQQAVVLFENGRELGLSQLLDEPRRALHVREQEGDGAGRELAPLHATGG